MNGRDLAELLRREIKHKKHSADPEIIAARTVIQMMSPNLDDLSRKSIDVLRVYMPEFRGTFLDVGCYGGWVYHYVKDKVVYHGIDRWPTGINVGQMLFGDMFECADVMEYKTQHDIVWASHLQPEFPITLEVVNHLKSLAKRLLIIVDSGLSDTYGHTDKGHNYLGFRK